MFQQFPAERRYYVYVLASRSRNLYVGVTNNLQRRLAEHRLGLVPGFTPGYRIFRLVHFEVFRDIHNAIAREKEINGWRREKKICLIKRHNRTWEDLAAELFEKASNQEVPGGTSKTTKPKRTADPSPPADTRPGSG